MKNLITPFSKDSNAVIAGQRVALNLQGIEKNEITRGVIIGKPGTLLFTHRVDATLKYLKLPFKPIKNDTVLRLHIATAQEEARLVVLNKDTIDPGEELFVLFRRLGMRVKMETHIRVLEDGKVKSIEEKIREETSQ